VLLDEAPALDGQVEGDPAWRGVEAAGGYRSLNSDQPSAKQTRFRLGYTAEALFVAVTCDEPLPDLVLSFMADGEQLWNEDSVEVFLSPDREEELQFVVNAIGSRASPRTLRKWEAATDAGESSWSVEVKLPWEVIGAFPEGGAAWGLNVGRNILTGGVKEHSTWALLEEGFHEPEHFGDLSFEALAPEARGEFEAVIQRAALGQFALLYVRPRKGVFVQNEADEKRVVYNQGPYIAPRLSPDGKWVLYNATETPLKSQPHVGPHSPQSKIQNPKSEMGVWLVDRKEERKRRICDGGQAVWSPDGARILFQREGRLIERELESGDERVVSGEGAPPLAWPSYGPDAAIVCTDQAGEHLYLLTGAGELKELAKGDIGSGPRCSPDGSRLAYQNGAHVHVMELVSGEARQFTREPGVQARPLWSRDGTSLCYAAGSSPFTDTVPYGKGWDIHWAAVDKPEEVNRVERNVFPAFDWNGAPLEASATAEVRGAALTLWQGKRALRLKPGEKVASQRGWERLAGAAPPGSIDGHVAVENDWLVLAASREGVVLIGKDDALVEKPITLAPREGAAGADYRPEALRLVDVDRDHVAIETNISLSGRRATLSYTVSRTLPGVVVATDSPHVHVAVEADLQAAIVPDWFGNDLVVDGWSGQPGAAMALPKTPLVLGGLAETGALVAAIGLSDETAFSLVNGPGDGTLAALCAEPGPGGVFVGVLAGSRLWEPVEVTQQADSGDWQGEWRKPFNAVWRLAVRGDTETYARTWAMDDLAGLGWDPLPIEKTFSGEPDLAVAYIWARDFVTSLDIWTPLDLLLSLHGVRGCAQALDIDGIRGHRTADPPVPFPQLSTRDFDWEPWLGHTEKEGFGVLEIMAGTFAAGTPGVRSFVRSMGGDAIRLLEGLDARIGEYEQHLDELEAACERYADSAFAAAVAADVAEALALGREAPRSSLAEAQEALESVVGILNLEGRVGQGHALCHQDEFEAFSERCRGLLAERQRVLAEYRGVAKRVRDGAARQMLVDPPFKPQGDALRELARKMLRLRYYLEGDWRGEAPRPWEGEG